MIHCTVDHVGTKGVCTQKTGFLAMFASFAVVLFCFLLFLLENIHIDFPGRFGKEVAPVSQRYGTFVESLRKICKLRVLFLRI